MAEDAKGKKRSPRIMPSPIPDTFENVIKALVRPLGKAAKGAK